MAQSVVSNLMAQGINNLAWDDLCEAVAAGAGPVTHGTFGNGKDINKFPPKSWMTSQLLGRVDASYKHQNDARRNIVSLLRPVDATHVPQMRIDTKTGVVLDWNRSMTDLTGIARCDVVGRMYEDILREKVPSLSDEYRNATLNWVARPPSQYGGECIPDGPEGLRKDHLWPLPLPLRGPDDVSAGRVPRFPSNSDEHCYFVELLAARADMLEALGYCIKPSFSLPENDQDTEAWFGGVEFTFRRTGGEVPSLQSLCEAIVPRNYINPDGSIVPPGTTSTVSDGQQKASVDSPWYEVDAKQLRLISTQIRSRRPAVLQYMREVLYHVRTAMRKMVVNKKVYTFTQDWTKNSDTAELAKIVLEALGGDEIVEQSVDKSGKLTWKLAFAVGGPKMSKEDKRLGEMKRERWERWWDHFMYEVSAVVGEHSSYHSCRASDAPYIVPSSEEPRRVILTLKIEGTERSYGSYEDEPFKSWAVVQVPATLNFFQLHRVVVQAMTCSSNAARATHMWKCKNFASRFETYSRDRKFHCVQLGETYFVENGSRHDYGFGDEGLFEKGNAFRQRVSRTAAYYDQEVPLSFKDHSFFMRAGQDDSVGKLRACIHSTCINAVFFQPGTEVYLEDGLIKYCTKYKLSCMRIEEYDGPLPENPDLNAFLPKCLRGKSDDDCPDWSVKKANAQLEADRGCLRRILCSIGSEGCMQQMPWCWTDDICYKNTYPTPLATNLLGLDLRPIFLHGEPPLPNSSSNDYRAYVSSLEGRIDPNFLQENVVGEFGDFSVPFGRCRRFCYGSDEDFGSDEESSRGDGVGWEREVDEEMKRVECVQPKSKLKSKEKKRKAES